MKEVRFKPRMKSEGLIDGRCSESTENKDVTTGELETERLE